MDSRNVVLFFKSSKYRNNYDAVDGVVSAARERGLALRTIEFGLSQSERNGESFARAFEKVVQEAVSLWHPVGAVIDQLLATELDSVACFGSLPVVLIDRAPQEMKGSARCVFSDASAIARCIARELFATPCVSAAYVPWFDPTKTWSRERGEAFGRLARLHGVPYTEVRTKGRGSLDYRRKLGETLAALPTPAAVFAANDQIGREVLAAVKDLGREVPGDFAVVSVDNNAELCERTEPTLSSIGQDFFAAGRLAIDALTKGSCPFPVLELERRASSACTMARDIRIPRMIEYIRKHATEGISTVDVVAELDCSAQFAARIFRRETGHSILREIQLAQLACVKAMLRRNPSVKQDLVARRCGFASAVDLRRVFRKLTGLTIGSYLEQEGGQ